MANSILIVEDDERLNYINRRALESKGYEVQAAYSVSEAREMLKNISPDVILLDVKLPDGNGFDFCREIRETTSAYIIFLTSVTESASELEGLVAGGDDYLRKPYGIKLLCERVKKGLRHERKMPQTMRRGSLMLDVLALHAYINDEDMLLSQKEFALLLLFLQNEGKVISTEYVYEKIWKQPMNEDNNAVKSAVKRLRKKMEGCGYTITTEYAEGYRFEAD